MVPDSGTAVNPAEKEKGAAEYRGLFGCCASVEEDFVLYYDLSGSRSGYCRMTGLIKSM
jgi:hypothetical protein